MPWYTREFLIVDPNGTPLLASLHPFFVKACDRSVFSFSPNKPRNNLAVSITEKIETCFVSHIYTILSKVEKF